jgi:D-beta-D-heptose 7-phosphate kinase/D-beta-D-heptose 1-phosphate adenosyltransferase
MFNTASAMEPASLVDRLRRSSPRVLVLGDAILDQFVYGPARRISPEAPVPVVHATHERYYPGGAANVMANLAAFDADVQGLAVVGPDAESARLKELLAGLGVNPDGFVTQSDWSTPRKCRVVAEGQHALRVDFERSCRIDSGTFETLAGAAQRLIPECDVVVISDYAKGTLSPLLIQSIVAMARDWRRPVIVDPKGCDASRYTSATVLTPNQAETEALTGVPIRDEESLARAAGALRRAAVADWVVVTRGDQGMAVMGEELNLIPPRAACARDVSGAGDTVVAATAFGLAAGLTVLEAATIANAAAAIAVARPGIATLSRAELLAAAGAEAPASAVVTRREMRQHAARLRRLGQRVVFTNGCFDVIHRGHLEYLEQSRALGDVLIVGLNSDASVRRLKGPGRPVNGQTDRARVLAGLRCVDYVVLFEEDTPYELIQELQPDVLTKGGDYHPAAVVGHDLVAETHVLDLVPGRSTTSLIQAIRDGSRPRTDVDEVSNGPARYDDCHAPQHKSSLVRAPA